MKIIDNLDKAIEAKDHTRNSFATAIGLDPYEFKKFITAAKKKMTPEREATIIGYIADAKNMKPKESRELTAEHRDQLKQAMIDKYGSVDKFCINVGMNRNNVYQVLTGQRSSIDGPVAKQLFEKLNVKP